MLFFLVAVLRRVAIQPPTYLLPEILFCCFAHWLGGQVYWALGLRLLCNTIH